jgi:hypothetical protein
MLSNFGTMNVSLLHLSEKVGLSLANSQLKPPPEAETSLGNVFPIDTG